MSNPGCREPAHGCFEVFIFERFAEPPAVCRLRLRTKSSSHTIAVLSGSNRRMLVRSTSRATAAAWGAGRLGHIGFVALSQLEEHLLSTFHHLPDCQPVLLG